MRRKKRGVLFVMRRKNMGELLYWTCKLNFLHIYHHFQYMYSEFHYKYTYLVHYNIFRKQMMKYANFNKAIFCEQQALQKFNVELTYCDGGDCAQPYSRQNFLKDYQDFWVSPLSTHFKRLYTYSQISIRLGSCTVRPRLTRMTGPKKNRVN